MSSEPDDPTEDLALPVTVFAGRARPGSDRLNHPGPGVRLFTPEPAAPPPRRPPADLIADTARLLPFALLALLAAALVMAIATR